ncbi:hypothetical protein [Gordonia amarae]|uniref:hypothetical protein n=1 Tax=Gordonia amarae TaxID=36821 RepID=UPI001AF6825A|nr:hypothetical protein [Gordonia amarae]QHN19498.1 hypothetical protein GII35_23225 [Gordonia amarae]QHN23974.1 hypothetical protein GII34_22725 [Gordonia amarae]
MSPAERSSELPKDRRAGTPDLPSGYSRLSGEPHEQQAVHRGRRDHRSRSRSGTQSFTSRSTYQLTGAAIQTDGYYAECRVFVNNVEVSWDSATGRYAVAVC